MLKKRLKQTHFSTYKHTCNTSKSKSPHDQDNKQSCSCNQLKQEAQAHTPRRSRQSRSQSKSLSSPHTGNQSRFQNQKNQENENFNNQRARTHANQGQSMPRFLLFRHGINYLYLNKGSPTYGKLVLRKPNRTTFKYSHQWKLVLHKHLEIIHEV